MSRHFCRRSCGSAAFASHRWIVTFLALATWNQGSVFAAVGSSPDNSFDLRAPGSSAASIRAVLLLEPAETRDDISTVRREVEVPGKVSVPLVKGSWTAQLIAAGFWCEKVPVVSTQAGPEVVLRLFAAGELRARVTAEDGQAITGVELDFEDVRSYALPDEDWPRGTIHCPVSDSQLRCSVPAGELDVRFRTAGYAPEFFWDVDIEPSKVRETGSLRFQKGGSVNGRVTDAGGHPVADARVRGEIATKKPARDLISMKRLERVAYRSTSDERGFFELRDMTPGTYRIVAESDGFAPSPTEKPVSIRGDLAVGLEQDLVLVAFATLEVHLSPPSDFQRQPWRVEVYDRRDSPLQQIFDVEMEQTTVASWSKPDLVPGMYQVMVFASDGSTWLTEDLELTAEHGPYSFQLSILEVRGRVHSDDEPPLRDAVAGVQHRKRWRVFGRRER